MEEITNSTDFFLEMFKSFGVKFTSALPSVLGALGLFLFGWFIAKVLGKAVTRFAEKMKLNSLAEKAEVNGFLETANITSTPAEILGKIMKWLVLLLTGLMVADTLNLNILSQEIGNLLGYLPKLFLALIFFIVGTYIAGFVRDFIRAATSSLGISTGRIVSSFVYYLLLIMVTLTALRQGGMDTTIITSNLFLILGAILFAAAISYGFASREVLENILATFYSRKTFQIGQVIEVDGEEGEIVAVSTINVTLKKVNGELVVIPSQILIKNKVKIK